MLPAVHQRERGHEQEAQRQAGREAAFIDHRPTARRATRADPLALAIFEPDATVRSWRKRERRAGQHEGDDAVPRRAARVRPASGRDAVPADPLPRARAAAGATLRTCRSCCGTDLDSRASKASCTRTVRLLRSSPVAELLVTPDREVERTRAEAGEQDRGSGLVAMPGVDVVTSISSSSTCAVARRRRDVDVDARSVSLRSS